MHKVIDQTTPGTIDTFSVEATYPCGSVVTYILHPTAHKIYGLKINNARPISAVIISDKPKPEVVRTLHYALDPRVDRDTAISCRKPDNVH
jgi:hypothetical protein